MKNIIYASLGLLMVAGVAANLGLFNKTPVEHKVVEIHMTANSKAEPQEDGFVVVDLPTLRGGTCSGEFISSRGDILTAKHCVDGFDKFEVVTYDRQKYTASVIATSPSHDLAMIHIDRRDTPYFRLASSVTRGEKVFALGSPLGITDTLTTGIIARVNGDETLLDCGVLPGNSGGPAFNKDGRLVGVVTAGYIVLFGTTHLNVAQGLDAVRFFVRLYGRG